MRPAEQTWSGHGEERAEALRRYWEDLDRGETTVPEGLDPKLAETIRHLRGLHAGSAPAGARDRVWHRLQGDASLAVADTAPIARDGRLPAMERPVPDIRPPAADRRRWSIVEVVAAALLIVALGIGYRAFWPGRDDPETIPGVTVPGTPIPATPIPPTSVPPTPTPTLTEETLIDVTIPAEVLPPSAAGASVSHNVLFRDTESTWTVHQNILLNYVLTGTLTVRSDSPARVWRASDEAWEEIPRDVETEVGPGDAVLLLEVETADFANRGQTKLEIVTVMLASGTSGDSPLPSEWINYDFDLSGAGQVSLPGGPAALRLRRVVRAPDSSFVAPPGVIVQLGVTVPSSVGGKPDVYVVSMESINNEVGSPVAGTPPP